MVHFNVPQDWFEANLQHQKCFFDRVRIRRRKNLWVSQSTEKSSICLAIRASSPIMFNKFLNHDVFAVTSGAVDRPTYSGSDVPPQDVFDNQFSRKI